MGTPIRTAGPTAVKGLSNILFNAGLSETGQFVQQGEFKAPESTIGGIARVGIPTLTGMAALVGDTSRTIGATSKAAAALSEARKLEPGQGVLVSEVLNKKGLTELEQRLFKDGVASLKKTADDMTVGMSDAIQSKLLEIGVMDEVLAAEFTPYLGKLKEAEKNQAIVAKQLADAEANVLNLKQRGLAPSVIADAESKATMLAAKHIELNDLRKGIVDTILGGQTPTLAADAGARAAAPIKERMVVLDKAFADSRDKLYSEGVKIGINDPMVSRTEFDNFLAKASANPKNMLHDEIVLKRIEEQANKVFKGNETISRGAFLNFRDTLAGELATEAQFANRSNKVASEAYEVLTDAADSFIRGFDSKKADALKEANEVMKRVYGSRSAAALEKLREGEVDAFTDMVIKQGPGVVGKDGKATGFWAEVTAYAKAGTRLAARAGDSQANAAVEAFYKDIGKAMKNSIATRALDRAASSVNGPVMDMAKFTADLQTLKNLDFKMSWMGVNPEFVQAARSMAEQLQGGLMEPAQLDKFLDDAARLGVDKAKTKMKVEALAQEHYAKILRDPLANLKQLQDEIVRLTGSRQAAEQALDAAKANPIIQLLDGSRMGLSEDPMQNGQFVSKMIVAGPGLAKAGADALIANGQGDVLNNLRKAIQAHIFNGLMEADATLKTKGGYRVKVGDVKEYFNSPKNIRRTETLKAWMGPERWAAIEAIKRPMEQAADTLSKLEAKPYQNNIQDAAVLAAGASRVGGLMNSWPILMVKGVANAAMSLHRRGRYATLNLLYIDPVWSKRFEAAGRNVEKFVQNPAAAVAYRLATQQDDELAANGNARP
jgi:hypothetical protein